MDALTLTGAQVVARCAAVARLQAVADDMARFIDRLGRSGDRPGTVHVSIAQGPLALHARAGWMLAQAALIRAQAGIDSPHIDAIVLRDPVTAPPSLRRLALTTLEATERRLHGWRPRPAAPDLREASR